MPEPKDEWMTTSETCEFLKLSRGHLSLLVKHNKIPHGRVARGSLRFLRSELDQWLRDGGAHPNEPQQ